MSRTSKKIFERESGSFRTSDGLRLSFQVGGNPAGPVILFCYGLACSSHHFKYQWEYLARRYRLLTLDYRGHNFSEAPRAITTLTFPRIAGDIHEFLEHLNLRDTVCLVGHSMGVNIALEFAARFAERVHSLVLIAGAAAFPANTAREMYGLTVLQSMLKTVDGLFPRLADQAWRMPTRTRGAERFAKYVGFNPALSKIEDIRECIRVMGELSPRIFFQLLGEYLRHDRRDSLELIRVPTLIIGGEKDKMISTSHQKSLHERIENSRYVVIPEASHCPQFDCPEQVNRLISGFLGENFKSLAS
ncbi:MAG: alpha/beta hydrolase [Bdellovibrionota bacterium]